SGLTREKHRYGKHWRQYFLLYECEASKSSDKAIVIYYHGGAWMFGSPEMFAGNAKFFTDRGHIVFMPSYRRLPLYSGKGVLADSVLALQQIGRVIKERGWEGRKIIMGGMSGGGNLAAVLYFDESHWGQSTLKRAYVVGLLLNAAPLNLNAIFPNPIIYRYAGRRGSSFYRKVNPIALLGKREGISILLIHGDKDGMVPYNSALTFVHRCHEIGLDNLTFHCLGNGGHMDAARWIYEENSSGEWIERWLEDFDC
ncbi:MAG TPA: hypothetical protein ENJ45_00385, partial [Phaeodactylibacter sp.]|nr:hypothetical protein [Phaeodactylibacter sp.]